MSSKPVDLFLTYQFLRRLSTPFEEWDAYRLGIIDKDGNVLRRAATLTKSEEIASWGYFDRMVANLKKLIAKVPGGKSKIASYAAALLLIKESRSSNIYSDEDIARLFTEHLNSVEEEIGNVAGAGNIAGIGVGAQGEPPVKLRSKKMLKRRELEKERQ